jgi:hypothetical protein
MVEPSPRADCLCSSSNGPDLGQQCILACRSSERANFPSVAVETAEFGKMVKLGGINSPLVDFILAARNEACLNSTQHRSLAQADGCGYGCDAVTHGRCLSRIIRWRSMEGEH